MTISEHAEIFAGKKVVEWEAGAELNPAKNAVRISVGYDEADKGTRWVDRFLEFLDTPDATQTTALVVGDWGQTASGSESGPVVEALVSYRQKLPLLDALFLGDMICEESEISWITQSDVGPLFQAFPRLREFVVRGGNSLGFGSIRHPLLQKLVIQAGGLDASVVRQILSSTLPELSHLEFWLGEPNYGATATIDDLAPLLAGKLFPSLKYLGLCNSVLADQIAVAIANAPILNRIEILDLSMGTLGDEGAQALANSPAVGKLKHLNIKHHYLTDPFVTLLTSKVQSIDASEQEEPDEWKGEFHRYISVGE